MADLQRETTPHFTFSKPEILLHLLQLALVVYFGLTFLLQEVDAIPTKTTLPSYLTTVIHRERDAHDLQW